MSYTIEKYTDPVVFMLTMNQDFDHDQEFASMERDVVNELQKMTAPFFFVLNIRNENISLAHMMEGFNAATRGEYPGFHHPLVRGVIYVVTADYLKIAAQGLASDIYGNVNIKIFDRVDDALTYAREHLD